MPAPLTSQERLRVLENYHLWSTRVICHLKQHDLAKYALGRVTEINAVTKTVHDSTFGYVAAHLSDDVMSTAAHCESAAALWIYLRSEYGSGKTDQREALAMQLNAELEALAFQLPRRSWKTSSAEWTPFARDAYS
jgi:hypothetical protein